MIKPQHAVFTVICLAMMVSTVTASETSLTFDAWTECTNWSTVTNADGWILRNGEIRASRGWASPYSPTLSGWLCDHEYNADAWIRSPLLTGGVGRVSYYCKRTPVLSGTNFFEVQWSSNLVDWLTIASVTNYSDTWIAYSNVYRHEEEGYVRFLKTADAPGIECYLGFDSIWIEPPSAIPLPPPLPTNIVHILGTGQSLSVGYGGTPPLTTSQPYDNLMLDQLQQDGTNLVPLIEGTNNENSLVETISSSLANTITSLSPSNRFRAIVTRHGLSSAAYSSLKKGTARYSLGLKQMSNVTAAASAAGLASYVAAVTTVHGESDHLAGSGAHYEDYLREWQNNYESDAMLITGQTNHVLMFLCQMSSHTGYGVSTSAIPAVQLQTCERSLRHILVCPKYFFTYRDAAHLYGPGYQQLGEYYGKAMKKVFVDGERWEPLKPVRITMTGTVITVDLRVPVPPVEFDTNLVRETTCYGFEYTDTLSSASITGVVISAPNQVQILLSAVPSGGNPRLSYAWTGIPGARPGWDSPGAARGNLRDRDTTPSLYGNYLYNWLVQFSYPVPTDIDRDDFDGDGLPDNWEYKWLNGTNTGTAADDSDGDGMINSDECISGNDPMVSNALPRVVIGKSTNTSGLALSLTTTADRLYKVERTDTGLSAPEWHSVTSWMGNGRATAITDPDAVNQSVFYRFSITNPPSY